MVLLTCSAALWSACTAAPTPPLAGAPVPFANTAAVVGYLEGTGVKLELLGTVSYAWFDTPGSTYQVGQSASEVLYVHEFASPAAADAAARRVSPDGRRIISPDNKEITVEWLGKPHLYQSGRLIVVYVGADLEVLGKLDSALGPQFAGFGQPAG